MHSTGAHSVHCRSCWGVHIFIRLVVFCRFVVLIDDLEMVMKNLTESVFKTVNTAEEGLRLLDIFRHLSTRKVRRLSWIYMFAFFTFSFFFFISLFYTLHLILTPSVSSSPS